MKTCIFYGKVVNKEIYSPVLAVNVSGDKKEQKEQIKRNIETLTSVDVRHKYSDFIPYIIDVDVDQKPFKKRRLK